MTHETAPADRQAELFDLLSDETRIAILRELSSAERSGEAPVSFTDLAQRTQSGDTGRFNYHLRRLRARLIDKQAGGYVLSEEGRSVAPLIAP